MKTEDKPKVGDMTRTARGGAWAERGRPDRSESFRARTFPHVDVVYRNALCLTGRREEAADLVVEAYLRAFEEFKRFGDERVASSRTRRETLAWLYDNLYGAFCDNILAGAAPRETPTGARP